MAERGYKLLEAIQRIPGHNDLGETLPSVTGMSALLPKADKVRRKLVMIRS
jgi:hypothetical protein